MNLEAGDRVEVIFDKSIYKGEKGTIKIDNTDKDWTRDYRVHLDGRNQFNYGFDQNELKLINE